MREIEKKFIGKNEKISQKDQEVNNFYERSQKKTKKKAKAGFGLGL